jgi:hypothetical protein
MRYLFLLIICIILINFFSVSSEDNNNLFLESGKNFVRFDNLPSFYVKDLIKINPSIEVVSYMKDNESIGYVNVFGGIGENFVITNTIDYEIIVTKETTLIIP